MGKADVRTIRVPKWVTLIVLVLVSAAMAAAIYSLSGRAYVQERASFAGIVALFHRRSVESPAVLATLAPAIVDILFFLPWGAVAFLLLDREGTSRMRTYVLTMGVGAAFALGLTAWQEMLPTRVTGWLDAGWGAAGCLAGALVAHTRKRMHIRFE